MFRFGISGAFPDGYEASMFAFLRSVKRSRLAKRPFPEEWEEIVEKRLKFVQKLSGEELETFRTHLKVFVWEKYWIGAKELTVTEEMKVMIAGQAARIVRKLPLNAYDRLTEIIIYPSHYVHPEKEAIIYGEAHHWGTVVLSWDAVRNGLAHPSDGHDTTIHEFAHVLDVSDGTFDGTPVLHRARDYGRWATVMTQEYRELLEDPHRGVVRAYGATNEAEFFAVATEAFFERPKYLRRNAPDLYKALRRFYQLDTATL